MTQAHLMIAKETTEGTYVTPSGNMVSNLQSWNMTPGENRIERRESGRTLGVTAITQGIHAPSGSMTVGLEPDNAVRLFQSLGFTSITTTTPGGTLPRLHGLLMNDDAALVSLSMQAQQIAVATTEVVNVSGVHVSSLTVNISTGNLVTLDANLLAWEIQVDGTAFVSGGATASPAAVTVAYGSIVRTFQFDDVAITLGGTPSLDGTSKQFTISGGTAMTGIEDISVTINMNKEQRHTVGSRYARQIIAGDRSVTGSMTIRNDTPAATYFSKVRGGTQEAINIVCTGDTDGIETNFEYEFGICIPVADYSDSDAWGSLSMNNGAKNVPLNFTGILDATSGQDIGVYFQNKTTSY